MEVMVERSCGIDIHQKTIVCCVLDGPFDTNRPKKSLETFNTTTKGLREAVEWVESFGVTHVFFESTGQYWIPVYNIFLDSTMDLILANANHVKNMPGRKTDKNDAEWIADLGRHGFIKASHLPCEEALKLRGFTRRYRSYKQKQTQCKNEIHDILQRANIKLTSYLKDIFGKTGMALLELFVNGEAITTGTVAEKRHGKVKASVEELVEAMDGKMSVEDRILLDHSLQEYRMYEEKIEVFKHIIEEFVNKYFPEEYQRLLTLPGVSKTNAAVILAEIGPNVETFETPKHLASWAGVSPGSNESAGIQKSSKRTRGNTYLNHALVISGGSAGRSKDVAFSSLYHRILNRSGKMTAQVACAHKLLRIIYVVLSEEVSYDMKKAHGQRQLTKSA